MMNFKVGNDIIETKRIKDMYDKFGIRFLKKIYTENEIKYCESKGKNKISSYAVRFAGKEAIFKAISDYLSNKYEIEWKDIEILNNESGRPYAKINGLDVEIDISLSHEKEYAIATAIVII